jgi:hypothetical protein
MFLLVPGTLFANPSKSVPVVLISVLNVEFFFTKVQSFKPHVQQYNGREKKKEFPQIATD